MAKAKVICTCEHCGVQFTMEKNCTNRKEAYNFEDWAKENCTECPECYRKRMEAERAEKASSHNLPELTGTEKQIQYAEKLRNIWISKNESVLASYEKKMPVVNAHPEKLDALINDKFPTREAVFQQFLKQYGLTEAHFVMSCTSAHDAIERLR